MDFLQSVTNSANKINFIYIRANDPVTLDDLRTIASIQRELTFALVQWSNPVSPDANTCIFFMGEYMVLALSLSGKIFRLDLSSWTLVNDRTGG